MLEQLLKIYSMSLATGVTSPLVHLFGPPGCGKSAVVKQLAELAGVNLRTINLSRLSPLELEGIQYPVTEEEVKVRLLHATYWTGLKDGDILFFDEFMRAYPEVMNGLLDIVTSREVGGLVLPNVFIMAASNSTVAYDKALEDRLLHLPVADPRKSKGERKHIAEMIVDELGLMPEMSGSQEMETLIHEEILPMYEVMDSLVRRAKPVTTEGTSVRKLIGQAQMREVQSVRMRELIDENNSRTRTKQTWKYLFLLNGKNVPQSYAGIVDELIDDRRLTDLQRLNARLNRDLIEIASIDRSQKE